MRGLSKYKTQTKTPKIMNKKFAIQLMKSGLFFSAEFTKKDGTIRTINGRTGVKKHLNPESKGSAYDARELGYLPVYDVQQKGYRLINLQTITKVNKIKIK